MRIRGLKLDHAIFAYRDSRGAHLVPETCRVGREQLNDGDIERQLWRGPSLGQVDLASQLVLKVHEDSTAITVDGAQDLRSASFISQRNNGADQDRIERRYAVETTNHVGQQPIIQSSVRAH